MSMEQQSSSDERMDRLEKAIFERFDRIDARLDKIEGRLDKIEGRLDKIEGRLDRVEASQVEMTAYLLEFRAEVINRFDRLESRVDLVTDTNRSIDMRLPGLTRAIGELQVRLDRLEQPAA